MWPRSIYHCDKDPAIVIGDKNVTNPKDLILDAYLHSYFMMLHYCKMGELTLQAGDSDSIIDLLLLVSSLEFLQGAT